MAMFLALHIFPNPPNAAHARPILRLMSSSHLPSSVISPPRYTNPVTCSISLFSTVICSFLCCFPIVIVFVFSAFTLSPILLLHPSTLFVRSCSSSCVSATRSMSSAKRRLFRDRPFRFTPASPSLLASLITISSNRLNKSADILHPCLTPILTLNHSVSSPSTLTALSDLLYMSSFSIPSSSGIPQCLIVFHNPSCHTLSNACL